MGVEIRTGAEVTAIEPGIVHLRDERLPAETIIWTAGVQATPVAAWLGVQPGHGGGVPVGADLTLPGHPEVFVIGDAALTPGPHGGTLPWLAAVARQQGIHVARAIRARLRGARALPRFHYRDYGTLATIGRNKAVADLGWAHVSGFPAWLLWAVTHIFFLIGFRSRTVVATEWLFAYLTSRRGVRLITGRRPAPGKGPAGGASQAAVAADAPR